MRPFTDNELKVLKLGLPYLQNESLVERLVARLEAAEHCIKVTFDAVPELIDMDSYQVWRKAKGE